MLGLTTPDAYSGDTRTAVLLILSLSLHAPFQDSAFSLCHSLGCSVPGTQDGLQSSRWCAGRSTRGRKLQ